MKCGEEDKVRELVAKLEHETQTVWRKQTKPLEEYLAKASNMPVTGEVRGKNVVIVAEENGAIVGLCRCIIVDRGLDKQGELGEFYIEKEHGGEGIGRQLVAAVKQLFVDEGVDVAFVWTHHGDDAAIKLYEEAGFKEVTQLVMAFVPPKPEKP
jgi:ribosomal protein S18 acetylase RimI-like enzyme